MLCPLELADGDADPRPGASLAARSVAHAGPGEPALRNALAFKNATIACALKMALPPLRSPKEPSGALDARAPGFGEHRQTAGRCVLSDNPPSINLTPAVVQQLARGKLPAALLERARAEWPATTVASFPAT